VRMFRIAALAAAVFVSLAATTPPARNWASTSAVTPIGSHVLGNPEAAVKLVEYVSYTCPHCAHFQQEAETPLRIIYVIPGKVSVELRHLVRDPVDLTAALLANCGDPARFWRNHNTLMLSQSRWIETMGRATPAQQSRWSNGPIPARMRAIAADFGFYALMAPRGYDRPQLDRCLADEAMARRLVAMRAGADAAGVESTPSFLLGDSLLAGTHDWKALDAQLKARF
jgi:protein-disulfide isomerase